MVTHGRDSHDVGKPYGRRGFAVTIIPPTNDSGVALQSQAVDTTGGNSDHISQRCGRGDFPIAIVTPSDNRQRARRYGCTGPATGE